MQSSVSWTWQHQQEKCRHSSLHTNLQMNRAPSLAFYSRSPPQHLKYHERLLNLLAKWGNILLRVNLAHFIFSIQHFSSIAFLLLGQFAWQWDISCLRDHLLRLLISYLKLLSSVCDILIISTTINCDVTNEGLWLWVESEIEKLKEFEEERGLSSWKIKEETEWLWFNGGNLPSPFFLKLWNSWV